MCQNVETKELHRSRSKLPCLYEAGGGYSNTGYAEIITNSIGQPKKAIFIYTRGSLACEKHAIIPVCVGDCVVTVDRHWDRVSIKVKRITAIIGNTATLKCTDDPICYDAIQAAVEKSYDYHCRRPYYIKQVVTSPDSTDVNEDKDFDGLEVDLDDDY